MAAVNDGAALTKIHDLFYFVTQINGQRVIKLQDEHLRPQPPKGSEIFVGKLPRNFSEHDLIKLFIQTGPIYKLRLMVDFNGRNRGYAFVKYFEPESASAAIERFHLYEVTTGCSIGVYKSVDNCRLFVGNLPRSVTKTDIQREFGPYAEGLNNIILYKSMEDHSLNRGFAFLEFQDHRCAAMTRRKLAPGTFIVWNTNILVDWADPIPEVDPKVLATVKKLYMRGLDLSMTSENLKMRLHAVLSEYSRQIIKVHKTQDFAFIHFAARPAAEVALTLIRDNFREFGEEMEVMWARPKIYAKQCRGNKFEETFCTSLPPKDRKMVHLRQQFAKLNIECSPQLLAQYLQQNTGRSDAASRQNNRGRVIPVDEMQARRLRSNL